MLESLQRRKQRCVIPLFGHRSAIWDLFFIMFQKFREHQEIFPVKFCRLDSVAWFLRGSTAHPVCCEPMAGQRAGFRCQAPPKNIRHRYFITSEARFATFMLTRESRIKLYSQIKQLREQKIYRQGSTRAYLEVGGRRPVALRRARRAAGRRATAPTARATAPTARAPATVSRALRVTYGREHSKKCLTPIVLDSGVLFSLQSFVWVASLMEHYTGSSATRHVSTYRIWIWNKISLTCTEK